MEAPEGIIFDLGDTLLEVSVYDLDSGIRKVLEYVKIPPNFNEKEFFIFAKSLDKEFKSKRETSNLEFQRKSYLKMLTDCFGLKLTVSISDLEKYFWDSSTIHVPEKGINQVITELKKLKISLGVLTNSSYSHTIILYELSKHGLDKHFDFIITSADYGLRKPNPLILQTAIKMINKKPNHLWFIGDSVGADILGAMQVDIVPVWYNKNNISLEKNYAQITINNWKEMLNVIISLE